MSYYSNDGAAMESAPMLDMRLAPTLEMPRNQFEPWIRVASRYKQITGVTPDLTALMLAAADECLALCPERRREPR